MSSARSTSVMRMKERLVSSMRANKRWIANKAVKTRASAPSPSSRAQRGGRTLDLGSVSDGVGGEA